MRQTISTKYIGPTNYRGSRVAATSTAGHRLVLSWDDAADTDTNHKAAAAALARKLDWHGVWACGATSTGCVFTLQDGDRFFVAPQRAGGAA